MLNIKTHVIINQFNLPNEIIHIIKDYLFNRIKKIPTNDERYNMLLRIPPKIYLNNEIDFTKFVVKLFESNEKKLELEVYYLDDELFDIERFYEISLITYLMNNGEYIESYENTHIVEITDDKIIYR